MKQVAAGNEISLVLTHGGEVWYSGYSELNNNQPYQLGDESRHTGAAAGQDAQIIEQMRQISHHNDGRGSGGGMSSAA